MRDLSGARINLTGYVIEAINDFIIEPELKLPLENASVNSLKLYTAEQWLVSALLGLNLARQLQGITSITARTSMANGVKDSVDNNAPQPPSVAKPYLSFSIENILSSGTFGPREQSRKENAQRGESSEKAGDAGKHPVQTLFTRLPWLAYTRYCPPKIPRSKPRKGCRRHKLDRSPRIPFSSSQLASLEAKFVQTQYLSGSEVRDLSSCLRVTEHRVKIWFQNRRAREKKTQAMSVVSSGSAQS